MSLEVNVLIDQENEMYTIEIPGKVPDAIHAKFENDLKELEEQLGTLLRTRPVEDKKVIHTHHGHVHVHQ